LHKKYKFESNFVKYTKQISISHPVEVCMNYDSSESLELRDQLDEQLLHQVKQRLTEGRIVQEGIGRSGKMSKGYLIVYLFNNTPGSSTILIVLKLLLGNVKVIHSSV
jgi:hypothetical protein